jgi:hypothetical protein
VLAGGSLYGPFFGISSLANSRPVVPKPITSFRLRPNLGRLFSSSIPADDPDTKQLTKKGTVYGQVHPNLVVDVGMLAGIEG